MKDLTNKMLSKLADCIVGRRENQQKLLGVSECVPMGIFDAQDNQLTINNEKELIERTKHRLLQQEVSRQKTLEDILEKADAALVTDTEVHSVDEEVDEGWFKQFVNYAQDITNEDLRLLWAKILANEVRRPDTYSLRTLEFLHLLSRKEAEVIRKMAQFVVFDINGEAYILKVKTTEEYKFNAIMMLMELGLLDNSSSLGITIEKSGKESINFFLHHYGTGTLIITKKENLLIHIYKLTSMGKEVFELNDDVPLNINYMRNFAEDLVKGDPTMSVTCAPIHKIVGDDVDLDEKHAYIKLGAQYQKKEE